MPERVRDIIRRQLDRLDEPSRDLVALAAVVGREAEFGLLHQASGLGEEAAARGVEALIRRRVLHSVGERLDFTHDRVREVAYREILAPRRKALHRRVAEALAMLHAENLEPHHLALGLHYFEGEVWDRAVLHLRRAGARRSNGSRSETRWPASSARSPRWDICRRIGPRWSRPSTFASSCGRPSTSSARSGKS